MLCKALQRSTCPWSPSKGEHIDVHAYLRRRSFCQCGSKAQPPFRGVEQDGVSLAMNMTTRSPFVYSPEGGRSNQVLPPRNTCQSNMLVGGAALYLPAPAVTQGWRYFSLSSVGGFVHCGINSNQALPWQSSGKISTYTKKILTAGRWRGLNLAGSLDNNPPAEKRGHEMRLVAENTNSFIWGLK